MRNYGEKVVTIDKVESKSACQTCYAEINIESPDFMENHLAWHRSVHNDIISEFIRLYNKATDLSVRGYYGA